MYSYRIEITYLVVGAVLALALRGDQLQQFLDFFGHGFFFEN